MDKGGSGKQQDIWSSIAPNPLSLLLPSHQLPSFSSSPMPPSFVHSGLFGGKPESPVMAALPPYCMPQGNFLLGNSLQARMSQYLTQIPPVFPENLECKDQPCSKFPHKSLFKPSTTPELSPKSATTRPVAKVKTECSPQLSSPESLSKAAHSNLSDNSTSDSEKTAKGPTFQEGITVGYTYDALFVSDGRSKRRINVATPKDQQRYSCSQCGKSYATSSNLSRHKQTHRPLDSNYAKKCPECGKIYVSMPALRNSRPRRNSGPRRNSSPPSSMHILTHKLEHKCDTCGKTFSRPWLLQGHMRSHTGQKPFGCAHCGKAFADRSNLRAHMQTHSGAKRYECEGCGKAFALKSYLNKHLEAACPKLISASRNLNKEFDHLKTETENSEV